ncbi:MAG: DUF2059 domain-containing protein [Gammaproteobacteria bacterium]|nr:DUF2059 domain-containing protein [Gammaproteobacteria bacterium]
MKTLLITVLAILLLPVAYGQENGIDLQKNKLLVRALEAMAYAPSFKQGVALKKQQSGKTTAFIEAVLSADHSRLNEIFAHVYAKYLSQKQIEELVRFYESPTGTALTAQQARDATNPNPSLKLDSKQIAEARAFTNSPTGRAFKQVSEDEKIWKEVGQEIRSHLLPSTK